MLFFKACPRCRGDVEVRNDWYGRYKECLQCGWVQDINKGGNRTPQVNPNISKDAPASSRVPQRVLV